MEGIPDLVKVISEVNSIWTIAAFTICAILMVFKSAGKIPKDGPGIKIFYTCVFLIFLIGVAPIIANFFKAEDRPYTFFIDVTDTSGVHPDISKLSFTSSSNTSVSTLDGIKKFTLQKKDIDDTVITFTAQTENKQSVGKLKISFKPEKSDYSGTIILKKIGKDTLPQRKTFSMNFDNPSIRHSIEKANFSYKTGPADYKITISYNKNRIIENSDAGTFKLEECYPEILVNGNHCITVNEYKIQGTYWVKNKSQVVSYASQQLRDIPDAYLSNKAKNILSCLPK
jgi:hypothetical protein